MHDGQSESWRQVIEKHHAALVDEISVELDSRLQHAVSHAIEAERSAAAIQLDRAKKDTEELTVRSTAESLNQILRRLRQAPDDATVFELLAEAAAPYAAQTVLLVIANGEAHLADGVTFRTDDAAAVGTAIESKDPVVALASAQQLSPALAEYFGNREDRKAYLYPVVERQTVTAMLVAVGDVIAAVLELLAEAGGLKLESLSGAAAPKLEPLPNPALVQIGAPAASAAERRSWDDLSPEDQKLHLQAQRVARVRVAEIRLYHSEALRKGVANGDIYDALTTEIEAARTEFLQTFLSKSTTMVDYLHLEILRSLAHDDDRLLGKNYPGPMV